MKPTIEYRANLLERLGGREDGGLGYLNACLEEGGIPSFLTALKDVVDARIGMTKLAGQSGMSRPTLYNALSSDGNPRLKNFSQIIDALGFRLSLVEINTMRNDAVDKIPLDKSPTKGNITARKTRAAN